MKGISFKPELIKAIVEGRKTQTRRVLNPQPFMHYGVLRWQPRKCIDINLTDHSDLAVPYARYHVGKVVYIKEAFTYVTLAEIDPWKDRAIKDGSFRRKPDGSPVTMCYKLDGYEIGADWLNPRGMPAWAARYFIQITGVETQRLQEIAADDCIAEGCYLSGELILSPQQEQRVLINKYARLWDSINPSYSWASNPWVWVYIFTRSKL